MVLEMLVASVIQYCKPMHQPKVCSKTITVCMFRRAKKMSKTQTRLSKKDAEKIANCLTEYKNIKVKEKK